MCIYIYTYTCCICKMAKRDIIRSTEGGKHRDDVDTVWEQTERHRTKWKGIDEWTSGDADGIGWVLWMSRNVR